MSGDWLALGAVAALAAAGAVRRGSRSGDRYDELLSLVGAVREMCGDEDCREALLNNLQGSGFETIGEGGSRVVVKLDGFVAKIAIDQSGNEQNWSEYETWTDEREGAGGEYLVPVLGLSNDDHVLFMDYAKPFQEKEAQEVAGRRDELNDHLSIYDADYDFNWGRHHGVMKVLDYGNRW